MTGREPWRTSPTVLAIATNTFLVTVFVDDRSFIYFSSVCGSLAFTLESLWSILINAGVWVGNDGGMMCVKFLVDWARLSYGYWHFFRVKLEFLLQFRERRQRMVCYNNSLPLHI